jgi:hypothetical protein
MRTKAGNSRITQRPSESRVDASILPSGLVLESSCSSSGSISSDSPASRESCSDVGYPPICCSFGRSQNDIAEFGGQRTPVIPSSARMGAHVALRVYITTPEYPFLSQYPAYDAKQKQLAFLEPR